jgi:heptosyltransferase-1
VLIVKLSSLGDVVHAMPAVQDIRQALPNAHIDWVVERAFAPLVRCCAGVERVIECDLRRWRRAPLAAETRQAWRAFRATLQAQRYDCVIDLQGLSKSAWVAWLAPLATGGERVALGHATEGSSWERPTRWVADRVVSMRPHVHAVQRSRLLCAEALAYSFQAPVRYGLQAPLKAPAPSEASVAAQEPVVDAAPLVALIHGTSRNDKLWPMAHWVALGQRLQAQGFQLALPHGDATELARAQALAQALPGARVWPRLPLDQLLVQLATCAGVVGVDSGLSHIAVALDLPHVQIYNFATAWRTGPPEGGDGSLSSPPEGGADSPNSPLALAAQRQISVVGQPTPTVDAVWRAWVSLEHTARQTAEQTVRHKGGPST